MHSNIQSQVVTVPDSNATALLARNLSQVTSKGDVIGLKGGLGSGKTTFARAFIKAWEASHEEIPSPTYTLVQVYEGGPVDIWHFDLYRMAVPEDAFELGIDEAFADGITLIEWPERLGHLLPDDRLEILIETGFGQGSEVRTFKLTGFGRWANYVEMLPDGGSNLW